MRAQHSWLFHQYRLLTSFSLPVSIACDVRQQLSSVGQWIRLNDGVCRIAPMIICPTFLTVLSVFHAKSYGKTPKYCETRVVYSGLLP